jgi:hypothetical protein
MFAARNMTFARPVAGGGGSFDPLSLSPALWLDASDSSTLYDAVTGGSLVAADGLVARWEDKSGNARHATQATSGSRAVRKTSQINSKDVLRFDGGDWLDVSSGTYGVNMSIFAVAKLTSNVSYSRLINNDYEFYLGTVWGDFATFYGAGSSWNDTSGNTPNVSILNSWKILGVVNNGTTAIPYVNATAQNSKNGTTVATTGLRIGANSAAANQTWIGDIAEVYILPYAATTGQRQDLQTWLNTKYAIY